MPYIHITISENPREGETLAMVYLRDHADGTGKQHVLLESTELPGASVRNDPWGALRALYAELAKRAPTNRPPATDRDQPA